MNLTITNQGLVITAPNSLLQYCAHMDKIGNYLKTHTDKLAGAAQFIVRQYERSALAKQRKAKQNLTAACNNALTNVRRTLRELVANFIEHTTVPCLQLRELLSEHQQANAPNYCGTKRFKSLRQHIQTTKAGTHDRF